MSVRRSALLDFMEEHFVILPPAPITGPFQIDNSLWLAEPAHALCDPSIREVTLQIAAQGGKNLLSEGLISYVPVHAPGNVIFYGQTDDDAQFFAETRAMRRARSIPIVKNVWPETKAAGKTNQIHLAHMSFEFLGINKSNARGKSAPWLICDEKHLKQWQGMGKVARMRCSAFWDHKIFNISTAGDEGCEIDLDFKRGSMEDWHLGCPECKQPVRLHWSQEVKTIVWSAPPDEWAVIHPEPGKWNFRELRKKVRFQCPHPGCNCELRDSMPVRREMNRLGSYIMDNPDCSQDHRSFHASQIAFPWVSWEALAEEWILALEQAKRGDLSNLRIFIIERMGQTWKRQVSAATSAIVTGGYSIIEREFEWEIEKERFMTVDVQERGGRHFWVVIRAWGDGGVSRLIHARRCESWDHVERTQEEFSVKSKRVAVDARHATQEVKEACAKNGWFYVIADMTRMEYDWLGPGGSRVKRPYARRKWYDTRVKGTEKQYAHGIIFSKSWARKVLANRITGQGTAWGLPDDVNNLLFLGTAKIETSYMAQLNSWVEKEEENKKTGVKEMVWVQINTDDHFRACEEVQLVLAAISGFFPSELKHAEKSEPPEN